MNLPLTAFVPRWLLNRLAEADVPCGHTESMQAAVLFADMVGFTPLTEAMAERGPQGVEALGHILGTVFGAFVDTIYAYGGDIVKFSGDAVIAFWLADEDATGAARSALATAQAIRALTTRRFGAIRTPSGPVPLSIRCGLGLGAAQVMVVGRPERQYFILSGPALDQATWAEKRAAQGEIVIHPDLHSQVELDARAHEHIFQGLRVVPQEHANLPLTAITEARLRPFVHAVLRERLKTEPRAFLADFRHGVVPVFVAFDAKTPAAIQSYVARAFEIITEHGGHLSEVEVGDKGNLLVLLFGAPLTRGDNSPRAAACAFNLATLPGTRAIGATSGSLFAGVVGNEQRAQYATFGDEMNLAARLMQTALDEGRAPPILVSAWVRRLAGDRFIYGERQRLTVKGKTGQVTAYPLQGMAQRWRNRLGRWAGQSHVVGRQQELAHLEAVADAVQDRRGQVVVVEGEAGMGKSRLVGELLQAWSSARGIAFLGGGDTATQRSPYHAWGELFRDFFDLRGDLEDVARVISTLVSIDPALLPRLPLLSDILDLGLPDNELTAQFDAQLRQQSTQALVLDLIRYQVGHQPLLLVLEDAHWLDAPSWEMALAVARAIDDLPVLLCLAHRPLEPPLSEISAKLTRLSNVTQIAIHELSEAATIALARNRLGVPHLPVSLRDLLIQKTQGHPFFVEEIINALRDTGTVRVEGEQIVLNGSLAALHLPDTIQGVVQARIDGLDERMRLTLKVASVIGRSFLYKILHDIHPIKELKARLRQQLDTLDALDITPLEHPEPQLVYMFKHAITQEVTYQTLAFAQRRALHRAVATWYEATRAARRDAEGEGGGETDSVYITVSPAMLAHHYRHAGDRDKERHYVRMSGEEAAARYANAEALSYFSRALELTPEEDIAAHYDLLMARVHVHQLQGNPEAQMHDLAAMQTLVEGLDEGAPEASRWRVAVLLQRADCALMRAQYQTANELFETALQLARAHGNAAGEVAALTGMGRTAFTQGAWGIAGRHYRRAHTLARAYGDRAGMAHALLRLGDVGWQGGILDEAERCTQEGLTIYREMGNRQGIADALMLLGNLERLRQAYTEAEAHYRESIAIYEDIGARRGVGLGYDHLGYLAYLRGDYDVAMAHMKLALAQALRLNFMRLLARVLTHQGFIRAARAQVDFAWIYLRQGLHEARIIGAPHTVLHALVGVAWVFIQVGQRQRAAELLALALNHPFLESDVRQDAAEPLWELLHTRLSPEALQAAQVRGQALNLDTVIEETLAEMKREAPRPAPESGALASP